ncbi:hypothetical protein O7626_40760 [Micromonospora sp. WMMD1102]|uniref:hypothetical protein n=1 Tax=Micromonospora sp. WMMD1102 TaxID=3016105 RepID=UPI002414E63B|nr:hypothetical protein [Micromonospora sp. WMMD1102]MDG4790382.1 hypothetical protein [Micromonospora sp. WMMD1102]MDG4792136.1 hypothetical protein [Micromonospora sp. WMMD1102]
MPVRLMTEHGPELDTTGPGHQIGRRSTCRYLTRRTFSRRTTGALDRCTAQVAEEGAEIELCLEHLAAALQLLTRRGITPQTLTYTVTVGPEEIDRMNLATQATDALADAYRRYTQENPS